MNKRLSLITATRQRAELLQAIALPSLVAQTSHNFEWIIVNDGRDLPTRHLISHIQLNPGNLDITYIEMAHPPSSLGFGLCHARNLGISAALGELICYLDDDNAIAPTFVVDTLDFFDQHPHLRCSMAQQNRRRDVYENGCLIRQGRPFISPEPGHADDLLTQRSLFDSNGFTHFRHEALAWNPEYRVFADYEFLLQCLGLWGADAYETNAQVLIQYVQRSDGVIGQSSYQDWADEMQQICLTCDRYAILTNETIESLHQHISRWQSMAQEKKAPSAFNLPEAHETTFHSDISGSYRNEKQ